MTKQGYLIAKNNIKDTFFTSSSSYDRPSFVAPQKATTYLTVELAESALKKLLKNGTFTARLVPLSEALSLNTPPEEQQDQVDPTQVQPDQQGLDDDEDEDDDQMVAQDQSGDPDAQITGDKNPDSQDVDNEVDQLLGNEQGAPSDIGADDLDDLGDDSNAQVDPNAPQVPDADGDSDLPPQDSSQIPPGEGELPQDGEEDPLNIEGEDDQDDQDPLAVRENMSLSIKQIPVLSVNKADVEVNDSNCETKCKVPSEVVSALSAVKAEYERQSKFSGNNEDHKAFALTVAGAMEELADLLKQGTVHGVKMAALKMTGLMSPIMHLVPDNVVKFISMGGRKPTLQDIFNTKRFDKKNK